MAGYVGNTDFKWFSFLRSQGPLDEVNFWQMCSWGSPWGRWLVPAAVPCGILSVVKAKAPGSNASP